MEEEGVKWPGLITTCQWRPLTRPTTAGVTGAGARQTRLIRGPPPVRRLHRGADQLRRRPHFGRPARAHRLAAATALRPAPQLNTLAGAAAAAVVLAAVGLLLSTPGITADGAARSAAAAAAGVEAEVKTGARAAADDKALVTAGCLGHRRRGERVHGNLGCFR